MKRKQYEKSFLFKFWFWLFTFLFLVLIVLCNLKMIKTYYKLDGVVVKEGIVSSFAVDDVLSNLYKNNFCYINNRKTKIKIEKVNLRMFREKKEEYHQVILSFPMKEKGSVNESISLLFFKENISFFSLFFHIWKGD